jgi:hypothetical protein
VNADEITLKDEHGAEVVSISVYRARRFRDRHLEQVCAHTSVIADPLEAKLTCRACKKQIAFRELLLSIARTAATPQDIAPCR